MLRKPLLAVTALCASAAFATAANAATTVSTYHADGNTLDSTSTHHGTWQGTPEYTAGRTGAPLDPALLLDHAEELGSLKDSVVRVGQMFGDGL